MKIILTVIIFCTLSVAGDFERLVDKFDREVFKGASWAFAVYSVSGKKIYEKNEDLKLVPASAVKLFSTAYAFDCLGPDYTIKTEVYLSGSLEKNVLKGDLVLKGYGDISFGSENFKDSYSQKASEIADVLLSLGVNDIDGSIFVDDSFYLFEPVASWSWEDIGNYYASLPHSFSVNDNLYKICFSSVSKIGDKAEISSIEPQLPIEIENFAFVGEKGLGDNSYIYSLPWINKIRIVGSSPPGYCIKGAMGNPASFFASYLKSFLLSKGINVKGAALSGEYPKAIEEKKAIKTFLSPPVKNIVAITNKKSFNLYAQGLYKLSEIKCSKNIEQFAYSFGASVKAVDACGLSRLNLFSASDFIKLLNYAASRPWFTSYMDSLYYPGDKLGRGHIKNIDKEKKIGRNLAIKSGSLKYVRSYAGYLKTKKGRDLSFVFIVNNYLCKPSYVDYVHNYLLRWLYENE